MPPKRKPLDCITGTSIANKGSDYIPAPQISKRRQGRPLKGTQPDPTLQLFPGEVVGLFEIGSSQTLSGDLGNSIHEREAGRWTSVELEDASSSSGLDRREHYNGDSLREDIPAGFDQKEVEGGEDKEAEWRKEEKIEELNGIQTKTKGRGAQDRNGKLASLKQQQRGVEKASEKKKLENLPLPPVFEYLESPFPVHEAEVRLPNTIPDSIPWTPGKIFRAFFDDGCLDIIAENTNAYAESKHDVLLEEKRYIFLRS
ncbi:hypothetical protein B9Z19DRAFT_136033 [Tuber borchii]|uniref:Uncharacterized protein n=1 Tax=Tuber borchii TaxID=42251 RepID=A0A2T7A6K6_TUBBO|nr:hypothetical protein B9Z19DRAFT_136033 [Tuber borchii]